MVNSNKIDTGRTKMGGFGKKDAAKETNSSTKDVSHAWHDARDDAAGSGHLNERNENKTSDSETGSILSAIFSIFRGGKDDD
jgi:hypothetical protein